MNVGERREPLPEDDLACKESFGQTTSHIPPGPPRPKAPHKTATFRTGVRFPQEPVFQLERDAEVESDGCPVCRL
jgi:hypothetical protein